MNTSVQIRKFIRKYQGIIVSVCIILGSLAGGIWGILPAIGVVFGMRDETAQVQRQVDTLRTKANILDAIDEDTYSQYLTDLTLAVPPDKSLTSVFSTIDGLSNMTGVTLSDFVVAKPGLVATGSAEAQSSEEKEIGSSLLPFNLTVTGTYDQVHNFLEQANNVRRFFRVRNFDIAFNGEDLSVKLGMDAFYKPFPTSLGSPQQAIEPLAQNDQDTIMQIQALPVLGQENEQPEPAPLPADNTNKRTDLFSP